MAARWGTGEEILTAHNMEFFSTASLDEAGALQGALVVDCMEGQGLHAGDVVETLHGCLDPSILSIFEDPPTGETKIGIDEESEATLLTALTEVLDNVDDENLSPFDTLPDVELLTGQKGHEHSPLRKLFCLSRSPPDRESMFNTRSFSSPGKSLPRMPSVTIQRSDGEDEEEATHLSDIEPTVDLLDWSSVALEQDGSCVSVTLGDLVKHMHCMAVCLEDGTDEQMLPEGGILLEVVDQGEHGEPILAIPDLSVEHPGTGSCQEVPDQTPVTSQQCPTLEADVSVLTATPPPQPGLEGQEEKVVIKRPKEEVTEKCPSRRKKKRKNKEAQSPPVSEGRVLRSAKKDLEKKPQEEQKQQQQQQKKMKKKVTSAPAISAQALEKVAPVPQAAVIDPQVMPQTPIDMNPAPKSDELRMDATAPKHSSAPESPPVPTQSTSPVPVPTAVPSEESVDMCVQEKAPEEVVASEPKPKPLSLQQYRLLRQQKRPAPLEKAGDNSTKWPSLPEAPKELPPIPCLQQPSPKDPRKASAPAASKEPAPEVKAVWQPKGLAAPPTPEALLVPPASLVAASSKPAVPKPAPVQASPSSSPASSLTPAPVPPPAPTPTSSSQPQSQSPSPAPLASSQNTTTSQASPCSPQPATALPAVYNDAPLPSATTPTASQVLKAIVSQPRIAQLLAAALKGQKLPVVSPQVRSDAPAQSDVYPRTTTEVQPAAAAAAAVVTAATAPPKVVASPPPPAAAAVSAAPSQAVKRPEQPTVMPKSEPVKVALPVTVTQQRQVPVAAASVPAAVPTPSVVSAQSQSRTLSAQPAQQKQTPAVVPPKGKSQTEELIESFTSEIGIEASDLASLLEQFEETQAKVERSVPEVFGRAAAVGNSSVEPAIEGKALEGTKVHDLGSTAGLTPPGTPPHQMWKPLVPAVLQGRSKTTDGIKQIPTKLTIQIDPRPLPANRLRGKAQPMAPNPTAFQPFSPDHDYCLPSKETSPEAGKRFNIKHQPSFTIRTVELPPKVRQQSTTPCPPAADGKSASGAPHPLDEQALASSVLVTPDASPSRVEPEGTSMKSPKRECSSGHQLCSPSPCCRKRGRARRRQSDHSRSSSSGSSSRSSSRSQSRSPPRKRCYRSRHSESTSSSRSRSRSRSRSQSQSPHRRRRYSYSSSRSGSWSRSRSRSNSPDSHRYWRSEHIPRSSRYSSRERQEDTKRRKEKAIEERRVVYVGRIRGGMTRAELKERFSQYGEIEDCTLHFREHGDNYGFVTYYDTKDAFTAIENGSKLRRPNELPFDLCFGGRRQFCKTSYADLDSSREYDPTSSKRKFDALDFDTLLKQAQRNLKR